MKGGNKHFAFLKSSLIQAIPGALKRYSYENTRVPGIWSSSYWFESDCFIVLRVVKFLMRCCGCGCVSVSVSEYGCESS
ncbi:hypothetical protein EYC80_005782 [Monilinia laxa]|uniref:Uncharacterized protein n=1 Tax=Monilinia laxa TaxID=61186 RepID=A0A5N6KF13_MONLA|nr:hypothetical protein EYC80_005782 [Monilinia laxa]